MTKDLKNKIAKKNKIVDYYQRGLLSEKEFQTFITNQKFMMDCLISSITKEKYKYNPNITDFNN